MQIQKVPLNTTPTPQHVSEYAETLEGFEAQAVAESENGFNVVIGEQLDDTDQTEKVIHVVACDGQLQCSNLSPHS